MTPRYDFSKLIVVFYARKIFFVIRNFRDHRNIFFFLGLQRAESFSAEILYGNFHAKSASTMVEVISYVRKTFFKKSLYSTVNLFIFLMNETFLR